MTKKKLIDLEQRILDASALLDMIRNEDTTDDLANEIILLQEKYKAVIGDYLKIEFERKINYRDFLDS